MSGAPLFGDKISSRLTGKISWQWVENEYER